MTNKAHFYVKDIFWLVIDMVEGEAICFISVNLINLKILGC